MCVICVSEIGVKQPSKSLLRQMWNRNPHGAGYMYARGKYVYIKKGFMTFDAFYNSVQDKHFTKDDAVVYHFRIATQGGVNPQMTHPFVLTDDLRDTQILSTRTNIGICHNGIISLTSNGDPVYSDTAYFITDYLSYFINKPRDLSSKVIQGKIKSLIGYSKFAFLDYQGRVTIIGDFAKDRNGLLFSNLYFMPVSRHFSYKIA